MPDYHCLNSLDDWQIGTGQSSTATVMQARENSFLGVSSLARIWLDTSAIGTDVVSAATIHWYNDTNSSKTGRGSTYDHRIRFSAGPLELYQNTSQELAGPQSHALDPSVLTTINRTGDTIIDFYVPPPNPAHSRLWEIRAWDYVPTGTFSVYMAITHAPFTGGPTIMTIIGG